MPEHGAVDDHDGGFTLIEVVVSLLLLAIVSTAALGLFIRSLASGDVQSQRQQAVELASQQIELVRALPVHSLVTGRTQAEVDALWASPGAVDTSQSAKLWDPLATATTADTVPTVRTVTLNSVNYTVKTFVDRCYEAATGASCGPTAGSGAVAMIRVAVGVTWSPGSTSVCGTATGSCGYAATTLFDPSSDPTFNNH